MDLFEQKECLDSMQILIDTREQPSERAEKRYKSFGCSFARKKLEYGDYTYNFKLPNGEWWYDTNYAVLPDVVIERKEDLTELSGNFFQHRDRFVREMERAISANAKIYLLVENGSWEHLINGKYRTKANPKAYFATMTAFMARYNISVVFCKEETSGKLIKEILYRELKERLERGEYECLKWDG